MCRFKSGIILKSKVVVAPGENDSHSDLLKSLGIEDDYIGASRTFVRTELIPDNDEWWVNPEEHPDAWKFVVDQDITPEWFDRETHEKDFREAVCKWWKEHVLVDREIDVLSSGYFRLKRCEIKKLCNNVKVYLSDSQVCEMCDSSQVYKMRDSSKVYVMFDSSQVGEMRGSSQVYKMRDSSQVGEMRGSSQVYKMRDSSQVYEMRESSKVDVMRESSKVYVMRDSSQVDVMYDGSQVCEMRDSSQVGEMCDSSQVGEMHNSSKVDVMYDSSQVGEMYDSSTARDFKNYPQIKVMVPDTGNFKLVECK